MTHYSNTGNPIDFPKLSAIDKLWGQALDQAVLETYSSLSLTQIEKVKTVFALLIVHECADICNKIYFDRYPDAEDFERSEEGDAIKKHFGVEL